ncbi:Rhodanese-like domain-containing protein [Kalaharituber pfeilii]|nr:Rhodanese-like domain-containing protein [Kalaharituber pfeilii]
MSREKLSTLLLSSPNDKTVVVVDVRDSDHIGGHIKSSRHVPSSTLDWAIPDLVRQLRNAPKVVFHCALSQQRGPSAAFKYLRERERINVGENEAVEKEELLKQEVYVLDGGFVKWQEKYGNDERLTENYNAGLWAYGY